MQKNKISLRELKIYNEGLKKGDYEDSEMQWWHIHGKILRLEKTDRDFDYNVKTFCRDCNKLGKPIRIKETHTNSY